MRETQERSFLFGPEIGEYIRELFKRGNELRSLSSKRKHQGSTQEEGNRELELAEWFATQSETATQKFLPYLDFSKP